MKSLRFGIAGCGKVAHLHAEALAKVDGAALAAACSRSLEKAVAFAAKYDATGYDDLQSMIRAEQLDAVIVCTPHPNHAEAAVTAVHAGAHVLVEKPLASTLADCDAIIAAAQKAGVLVGTVSQRRYYPPCIRIRQAIDAGKIGTPILGTASIFGWRDAAYYESDAWRGTWNDEGGGVLVNQSPHQLDLLNWYMGEPEEVFGFWANLNHPTIEVDDTAVVVIRYKGGGLGNVVVSNSQNPALHARVTVHGSNGASLGVQTDGGAMFVAGQSGILEPPYNHIWTVPGEDTKLAARISEDAELFESVDATSYFHALQIRDFASAIRENRQPMVTAEDGRRTVAIFAAIYESNQTGRAVKISR